MIIEYNKYSLILKPEETVFLPRYKGSTFRGGFGVAFKKVVCVFRQKECRECTLNGECAYSYIFETPPTGGDKFFPNEKYATIPHPFVIEPPLEEREVYEPSDLISLDLILIGRAVKYLLYFIMAFEYLGEIGIGRGRGKFRLAEVRGKGRKVYSGDDRSLSVEEPEKMQIPEDFYPESEPDEAVRLEIVTPLRMRYSREFVAELEFYVLVTNLMRRMALLNFYHGDRTRPQWDHRRWIESARNVVAKDNCLSWVDWERYSHRQRTKMKMGGVVGSVTYEGRIRQFMPLLRAGEIFHAGKGTSFGLGKYRIAEHKE